MSLSVTKPSTFEVIGNRMLLPEGIVCMAESVLGSTVLGINKVEKRSNESRVRGPETIKLRLFLEGSHALALASDPEASQYLNLRLSEVARQRGRHIDYSIHVDKESFGKSLQGKEKNVAYGDLLLIHASDENGSKLLESHEVGRYAIN